MIQGRGGGGLGEGALMEVGRRRSMFTAEPIGFADSLDEAVCVREQEPKIAALVILGCPAKCHRLVGFKSVFLFLTLLETWKSQVKVPAGSGLGEAPGLHLLVLARSILCVQKESSGVFSPSYKGHSSRPRAPPSGYHPTLATSQWPHL